MRAKVSLWVAVAVWGLASACSEAPPAPSAAGSPSFARGGQAACPLTPDVVVGDEAGLLAALAAASPGDVIGLDGFFGVSAAVQINTSGVTLTCASAGSGLFAVDDAVSWVLVALADGVDVNRLVLDGTAASNGPYLGRNASDVRFTDNTVTCGPGQCAFFVNAPGAVVADNHFESQGSVTGVHLQGLTDGARVEGNTVVAAAAQTFGAEIFGGIRARDGSGLVIVGNEVGGPWHNSIHLSNLNDSQIKSNRLTGATFDALLLAPNILPGARSDGNVFRNNRMTGAGEAGVWAVFACDNVFLGNNLNSNANDMGAVFNTETGANTLNGNENVVVDNGAFDCDGDGVDDPNIINGSGAVQHGVNLGEKLSGAASTWNDVK